MAAIKLAIVPELGIIVGRLEDRSGKQFLKNIRKIAIRPTDHNQNTFEVDLIHPFMILNNGEVSIELEKCIVTQTAPKDLTNSYIAAVSGIHIAGSMPNGRHK